MLLTQTFHPWLRIVVQHGQTAAWILVLLSGMLTALLLWPVAVALRRLPGKGLMDLAEVALGRWASVPLALLLAGTICFSAAMIMRETSEMALSAVFPHTPQTFVTTALMIGALYIAWGDSSALVRLGRLILPATIFAVLVVLGGSLGWGELRYLTPFWGPGPVPLLLSSFTVAKMFAHFAVVAVLTPQIITGKTLVRDFLGTVLVGAVLIALVKMILVMTFAYPLGVHINMPLHMAARLLVGGRFFERMEGIFVFMWVIATTVMLGAILHVAAVALARAFRIPRHITAVPALATIILTLAFFPPDLATTVQWHQASAPVYVTATLYLPAALALIALLRLRRRKA